MQQIILFSIGLALSGIVFAQDPKYYENNRGQRHLCGTISLSEFEKDTVFSKIV